MNDLGYVYVDEHLVSPSLVCPICLDVLREPHTHITCDSAFCRSCLLQLAEPFCPICRWTWSETIPLDYNIYLPKASRLIRNMLDDLRVQCVDCHEIRRRGQFEHQCQPKNNVLPRKSFGQNRRTDEEKSSTMRFALIFLLWLVIAYYNRTTLFVPTIDRSSMLINHIAVNLDGFVVGKCFDLINSLLNNSIFTTMISLLIWFALKNYGEHYVSKRTSHLFEFVFETSIIVNLIVYSLFY